jgi:hypothetical protein
MSEMENASCVVALANIIPLVILCIGLALIATARGNAKFVMAQELQGMTTIN